MEGGVNWRDTGDGVEARAPVAEEVGGEVVRKGGEEDPAVEGSVDGGEGGSEERPVDGPKDMGQLAVDKREAGGIGGEEVVCHAAKDVWM